MFSILFNPKKAERHPGEFVLIAIFYSSISILLGSWIFPEFASLIAVFFTLISCFYLTQNAIKIEADKENSMIKEKRLLKEHIKPLKLFLFLFLGIVISFAFWTFVLPQETVSEIFSLQEQVLAQIRGETITGDFIKSGTLSMIITNNIQVLFTSFIIALFYGAGGIFVIVWNASMMGYVIGMLTKTEGIIQLPRILLKYSLHGIPEILSYLLIILAGAIISINFFKGNFKDKDKLKIILLDTSILLVSAIVVMILAAIIETYLSPLI